MTLYEQATPPPSERDYPNRHIDTLKLAAAEYLSSITPNQYNLGRPHLTSLRNEQQKTLTSAVDLDDQQSLTQEDLHQMANEIAADRARNELNDPNNTEIFQCFRTLTDIETLLLQKINLENVDKNALLAVFYTALLKLRVSTALDDLKRYLTEIPTFKTALSFMSGKGLFDRIVREYNVELKKKQSR